MDSVDMIANFEVFLTKHRKTAEECQDLREVLLKVQKHVKEIDALINEAFETRTIHPFVSQKIEGLKLSVRTYNLLKNHGVHRVEEIVRKSEADLLHFKGGGRKFVKDVNEFLQSMDLRLEMSEEEILAWRP